MKRFIQLRDAGICRTPYCDAPVRHVDHAVPVTAGAETTAEQVNGRCEACNYAKEAPGRRARPSPSSTAGAHEIETTSPTGHTYRSKAPPQPGTGQPTEVTRHVGTTRLEIHFTDYVTEYTLAT